MDDILLDKITLDENHLLLCRVPRDYSKDKFIEIETVLKSKYGADRILLVRGDDVMIASMSRMSNEEPTPIGMIIFFILMLAAGYGLVDLVSKLIVSR